MKLGVITPIGPGHADAYQACLGSIRNAWSNNRGKFTGLEVISMDDLQGRIKAAGAIDNFSLSPENHFLRCKHESMHSPPPNSSRWSSLSR